MTSKSEMKRFAIQEKVGSHLCSNCGAPLESRREFDLIEEEALALLHSIQADGAVDRGQIAQTILSLVKSLRSSEELIRLAKITTGDDSTTEK